MPDIDHRTMTPPFLRVQHEYPDAGVRVWDLRLGQPNVAHVATPTLHSIEHFLGVWLREASPAVLSVGLMGCQTGLYLVTTASLDADELSDRLSEVLDRIGTAREVPLADVESCGWAEHHSLVGARALAEWLLSRRGEWTRSGAEPAGAAR